MEKMRIAAVAAACFLSVPLVFGQSAESPAKRLDGASGLADAAAFSARNGDLENASAQIGVALGSGGAEVRAEESALPSAGKGTAGLAAQLDAPSDKKLDGGQVPPADAFTARGDSKSFGSRISQLCSDRWYAFDCLESPSIALLNSAADDGADGPRHSTAGFLIKGAAGLILGAILFVPAMVIAIVVGLPAALSQ